MKYSTTVTSKGQMTLSAEIRRKLSIKTGERVSVSLEGSKVVIEKDNYWEKLEKLSEKLTAEVERKGLAGMPWEEVKKRAADMKAKDWQEKLDRISRY